MDHHIIMAMSIIVITINGTSGDESHCASQAILIKDSSFLVPEIFFGKYDIADFQKGLQTLEVQLNHIKEQLTKDRKTQDLTDIDYSPIHPHIGQKPGKIISPNAELVKDCKAKDGIFPSYPITYGEELAFLDLLKLADKDALPIETEYEDTAVMSSGHLMMAYSKSQDVNNINKKGLAMYNPGQSSIGAYTSAEKNTGMCLTPFNPYDDLTFNHYMTENFKDTNSQVQSALTAISQFNKGLQQEIANGSPDPENPEAAKLKLEPLAVTTSVNYWAKLANLTSIYYNPHLIQVVTSNIKTGLNKFNEEFSGESHTSEKLTRQMCDFFKITCSAAYGILHQDGTFTLNAITHVKERSMTSYQLLPLVNKDGEIFSDKYLHTLGDTSFTTMGPLIKTNCYKSQQGDICKFLATNTNFDCGNAVKTGRKLKGSFPCEMEQMKGIIFYPYNCEDDATKLTVLLGGNTDMTLKCADDENLNNIQVGPGNHVLPSGCDYLVEDKIIYSRAFSQDSPNFKEIIKPLLQGTSYQKLNTIVSSMSNQEILSIAGIVVGGSTFILFFCCTIFRFRKKCKCCNQSQTDTPPDNNDDNIRPSEYIPLQRQPSQQPARAAPSAPSTSRWTPYRKGFNPTAPTPSS